MVSLEVIGGGGGFLGGGRDGLFFCFSWRHGAEGVARGAFFPPSRSCLLLR
jgi:hypothetical protein